MKKLSIFLTALITAVFAFAACAPQAEDTTTVKFIVPNGSPAIAIAKLIADVPEIGGFTMDYQVVAGPDPLRAAIQNGSAQLAILPTNLASQLYNQENDIQLVSVVVHGSLFLVSSDEEAVTLSALKGKTVYSLAGTSDVILKHLLTLEDINYNDEQDADSVTIEIKEGAEITQKLKSGVWEYGILGEPNATVATTGSSASVTLSLNELWIAQTGVSLPQASLVASGAFLRANPDFIDSLLSELSGSVEWAKESIEAVKNAITTAGGGLSLPALNADMIERSSIDFVTGTAAKTAVNTYLDTLKSTNAALIGGKLPDDGFYYSKSA